MALTPNEILNKEFDTKFRGYNIDQVNDYLDIIVAEYEKLIQQNNQLQQELETAKEKNEYFAQLQESLNSSIVVAQEAADRLKQNARKEAELILYEAEREADSRVNEANEHAQSIITETEALRRNSQSYRKTLEKMIRQQLELVTSDEYIELFDTDTRPQYQETSTDDLSQRTHDKVDRLTNEAHTVDTPTYASTATDNYGSEPESDTEPREVEFVAANPDNQDEIRDNSSSDRSVEEGNSEATDSIDPEATQKVDLPNSDINVDKQQKDDKSTESVLGQTIRIELPKD